jgi:hypothetical protein
VFIFIKPLRSAPELNLLSSDEYPFFEQPKASDGSTTEVGTSGTASPPSTSLQVSSKCVTEEAEVPLSQDLHSILYVTMLFGATNEPTDFPYKSC